MNALSESQRQDVAVLLAVCRGVDIDAVIIGATAYRLLFKDSLRYTLDIDWALTLDLDDFARLEDALTAKGWERSTIQEPRWITPRDNRFDLVPAGPTLRKEGRLVWPRTGFVMSLAGFDHVFDRAIVQEVGGGLRVKVVPPAVLALLKIVAFTENPGLRAKDLDDVKALFRWYEQDSDRIFSDAVIEAQLPDVEFAAAFLLGLDVREIADQREGQTIESFLDRLIEPAKGTRVSPADDDWTTHESVRFQYQLRAFSEAFRRPRS